MVSHGCRQFFAAKAIYFLVQVNHMRGVPSVTQSPRAIMGFVFNVAPFWERTLRGQVRLIAPIRRVFILTSVEAAQAHQAILSRFSILPVRVETKVLVASFPAARDASPVRLQPFKRDVINYVVGSGAATILRVFRRTTIHLLQPQVSIVIRRCRLMETGIRRGAKRVLTLFKESSGIRVGAAKVFRSLFRRGVTRLPIVIILSYSRWYFGQFAHQGHVNWRRKGSGGGRLPGVWVSRNAL